MEQPIRIGGSRIGIGIGIICASPAVIIIIIIIIMAAIITDYDGCISEEKLNNDNF